MSNNVRSMAQVTTEAVVTALSFSALAQAMGILISGTSMSVAPRQSKATRQGIIDLRQAFGNEVVDKALKDAGSDADIVSISEAVDQEFNRYLRSKYTEFEVATAINTCPAGDLRCVYEVANRLHNKGVTAASPPAQIVGVSAVGVQIAEKKKSTLAGPHAGKKIYDRLTKTTYPSRAAAARAVKTELGLDDTKSFWEFKIEESKAVPGRKDARQYVYWFGDVYTPRFVHV
jgi:hypothetical protein